MAVELPVRAIAPPARPSGRMDRIRWTLVDGRTVVWRNLMQLKSQPGELVGAIIFPAIMVVLFGYVFGSAIKVPGGGNYREYLMPGLFAMTALTSLMTTMLAVATDASKGVMDRFRSMPMARSAVPFGQVGGDILIGVVGLVAMVGCGYAVGWRIHHGILSALAAFGLLILLRYALSWAGVLFGLLVKNEETADQMLPLVFPLSMLSNSFVPTAGMPAWLRVISDWNPVSAVVAACRGLFGNPGVPAGHVALPLQHPVVATLLWSTVLLAVFAPLAIRRYRTANR
ncbi:ABC transporter permease [Actinoallomurus bryophytorum]|uniref:Transport permease protein n=1 Tax=Actinoallomurus bryophytorum TaxID=1490222 RepID=A0A543BSX9_9ACTN|nr:ABC transporter permease [Actinoallomurus bryophytorum]TQL87939.1 ABC-2 type transport system permease protein [Actinoallomurus bryophytorum]